MFPIDFSLLGMDEDETHMLREKQKGQPASCLSTIQLTFCNYFLNSNVHTTPFLMAQLKPVSPVCVCVCVCVCACVCVCVCVCRTWRVGRKAAKCESCSFIALSFSSCWLHTKHRPHC